MENTYFKNLLGKNALVFVSNTEAYNTGDFDAFETEGAGTFGIFLKDGTAKTDALATGDEFFLAQVLSDGTIKKSQVIAWDDIYKKQNVNYIAPVKQEEVLTIGAAASATTDELYIEAHILTTANQPYPIDSFNFVSSTGAETTQAIAEKIVAEYDRKRKAPNKPDVIVGRRVTGTRGAFAAAFSITKNSTSLTGTGIGTAATVGDVIMIKNYAFKVVAIPGANEVTIDRPYEYETISAQATSETNSGTYTSITAEKITLTSRTNDIFFKTIHTGDIATTLASGAAWKQGSGTYEMVKAMEEQSNVLEGNTYANVENRDDWEKIETFTANGTTYDLVFLDYKKTRASVAAPNTDASHRGSFIIAVPSSGYTQATLETVLGVTLT